MKSLSLLCLAVVSAGHALAEPVLPTYAGQLVVAALRQHPEVLALTIHARAPKSHADVVVGSSNEQIGTPAGPIQLDVLRGGASVQQVNDDRGQVSTIVPLQDVSGDQVGVVTVVERFTPGARGSALHLATTIRDELRRHIINAANLSDSVPYTVGAPSAPYAQHLVDQMMSAHPELLVAALHVAALSGDDYPIIASSIGRIGKMADEDDLRVIHTLHAATGAYGATKSRYGIEVPMFDQQNNLIGALSVGYAFKPGDDETELLRRAQQLESDLRKRIPSLSVLYGPAH